MRTAKAPHPPSPISTLRQCYQVAPRLASPAIEIRPLMEKKLGCKLTLWKSALSYSTAHHLDADSDSHYCFKKILFTAVKHLLPDFGLSHIMESLFSQKV